MSRSIALGALLLVLFAGAPAGAAAQSPVLPSCTAEAIRAAAAPNALPIIDRALDWVYRGVSYCQCVTGAGGPYRTDCSGLVAMAWELPAPGNTTYHYAGGPWDNGLSWRLGSWDDIAIGDATNYPGNPDAHTGHIRLFAGWLDAAHTQYCSIEEYSTGHPAEIRSHWLDTSIYLPIRKSGWAPVYDRAPEGWIDAADCASVRGWAHDPDDPAAPIAVHVYLDGPAGDPVATGYAISGDLHRDDVGEHGFAFVVPNGFRDGLDHAVYAYGIGLAGGANAVLMGSPATFRCDPPQAPFPAGTRRRVDGPAVMTAWQFDPHDAVAVDAAALAGFDEGDDWPSGPELIAVDGEPEVYLRDTQHGVPSRRHVPGPEAMDQWALDGAAVVPVKAALLRSLPAGPAISAAPYLVVSEGTVYVIDAPSLLVGEPEPAELRGPPYDDSRMLTGGCSAAAGPAPGTGVLAFLALVLLLGALGRRALLARAAPVRNRAWRQSSRSTE